MPPAARMGDGTAHGGRIAAGEPRVLIGGAPAARAGDAHLCPLTSGAVPHTGGPVATGSAAVLITGRPAARVGDLCTCCGPPDVIATGTPTVHIGDGGPGQTRIGGGAGLTRIGGRGQTQIGGAGAAGRQASSGGESPGARAARAASAEGVTPPAPAASAAGPLLSVRLVDTGGRPLAAAVHSVAEAGRPGDVRRLPGSGRIDLRPESPHATARVQVQILHNARWTAPRVRAGEPVALTACAPGIADGTPVRVIVRRRTEAGEEAAVAEMSTAVRDEQVRAVWSATEIAADEGGLPAPDGSLGAAAPHYIADVGRAGHPALARTGPLAVVDALTARVVDEERRPIPDCPYRLLLPGGAVRTGRTTRAGVLHHPDLPAGSYRVIVDPPRSDPVSEPVPAEAGRPVHRALPGRPAAIRTGREAVLVVGRPWLQVSARLGDGHLPATFVLHSSDGSTQADAAYWHEIEVAGGAVDADGRIRLCFPVASGRRGEGAVTAYTLRCRHEGRSEILFDALPLRPGTTADAPTETAAVFA